MTPKELETKQNAIQNRIYEIARMNDLSKGKEGGIDAIPDGVAHCEKYLNSSPRIAWILKEPYDDFKKDGSSKGGGWRLYDGFLGEKKDWIKNTTWQRIIYTMFGLHNGKHYREMDYVRETPGMGDVMLETVILNLSKMPAGTTSNSSFAKNYEKYWASTLKEQIELYNPQVVIFGNTFNVCWPLFVSEDSEPIRIPETGRCFINLYKNNGRILLDAYHPGIRSNVEFYVDSLIDTIKEYFPI